MYEKALKTFPKLSASVLAYLTEQNEKDATRINNATNNEVLNSWYLKELTTPKTLASISASAPSALLTDEVKNKMIKKAIRKNEKSYGQRMGKLEDAASVETPQAVNISVEWVKSRTWGYNPHATVTADRRRTFGSASGCGYDKQSAAICSAMNSNAETLNIIYTHAENDKKFPDTVFIHSWNKVPHYEGGCGMSVFPSTFEAMGYTFRHVADGKTFDAYTITKNA